MNVVEPLFRHALTQPDAPAIIAGDRIYSYRELMARVQHLATQLDAAGVQRGELVATVAETLVPQLQLTLALAWLGAASMAFNRRDAAIARDYGIKRLVYKLREPGGFEVPGVESVDLAALEAAGQRRSVPLVQCEPGDMWRVCLSSGTTGRAKAIVFSHQCAMLKSQLLRVTFAGDASERLMVFMGTELALSINFFLRTLQAGGTIVRAGATAKAALDELRRNEVTMLLVSPGNALLMAEEARRPGSGHAASAPSLRAVCIGGSQVGAGLYAALVEHLSKHIHVVYGASETGPLSMQDPALQARAPTSGGRILPWVELQAVNERGEALVAGERGALRVRTPGLATGYLYPEGMTPEDPPAFRDGWFHLGDHGFVTKEGLVFLGGRSADVLNVGGNKVAPTVIEEVIERDTAITESAVIVMESDSGRPVLVALVVSAQPVDALAVKQCCAAALGAARTPAAVLQVASLPRNEGGKVMRGSLASMALDAQRAGRAV